MTEQYLFPKDCWFFEEGGLKKGPTSEAQLIELLRNRKVARGALVWQQGFEDWRPVEETRLAIHLATSAEQPPAIRKVSNDKIWLAAFAPLLCLPLAAFLEGAALGKSSHFVSIIACAIACFVMTVLTIQDEKRLRAYGHDTSDFASSLYLAPLYVYKRQKAMRQGWYWPLNFVLSNLAIFYVLISSDLQWIFRQYLMN